MDTLVLYFPAAIVRVRGRAADAFSMDAMRTPARRAAGSAGDLGLIWWLYCALLESSRAQGTLGQQLLGMRVCDDAARRISFVRATRPLLRAVPLAAHSAASATCSTCGRRAARRCTTWWRAACSCAPTSPRRSRAAHGAPDMRSRHEPPAWTSSRASPPTAAAASPCCARTPRRTCCARGCRASSPPGASSARCAAAPRRAPLRLLCEVKRASPSRGVLRDDVDPVAMREALRRPAAPAAVSLVTEPDHFQGDLAWMDRGAARGDAAAAA